MPNPVEGKLRRSKRRRQRGASLVEMALVLPVLMLTLIGMMETGLAFQDYLTVAYVSREGARVGAFLGDDIGADCAIVRSVAGGLTGSQFNRLNRLEIFRADASGNQVSGDTNTYSYNTGDPQDCDNWTGVVTWPETDRQVVVGSQPLDILGVRVVIRHDWVTGFPPFNGSFTINEETITRMEPEAYE
jgi:Flp pilus assembly protein TadG